MKKMKFSLKRVSFFKEIVCFKNENKEVIKYF